MVTEKRAVIDRSVTAKTSPVRIRTVNIVRKDSIEKVIEVVGREYKSKFGYEASFYIASAGDGASILREI